MDTHNFFLFFSGIQRQVELAKASFSRLTSADSAEAGDGAGGKTSPIGGGEVG